MELNIIVCVKSVVINAPGGKVIRSADNCELNVFDRPAIEMAVKLREENGGTVTAVTMGPDTGAVALYEALAMGVDRAVLLSDRAFAGSDTLATSKVLAACINKLKPFDLVIFGVRTSDSDTGQVGPQTAVHLRLPCVTGVTGLEAEDSGLKLERTVDEYIETLRMEMPGVLSIDPRAVQPRDPGLSMIEKAFKAGAFEIMNLSDLNLTGKGLGTKESPTKLVSMNRIKRMKKCEFIEGTPEEQADELVKRLRSGGYIG